MLKHVLGSKMGKADSLSRRPDWEIRVEKDNKNKDVSKTKVIRSKKIRGSRDNSKWGRSTRGSKKVKGKR